MDEISIVEIDNYVRGPIITCDTVARARAGCFEYYMWKNLSG